jgi:hypothetical protein
VVDIKNTLGEQFCFFLSCHGKFEWCQQADALSQTVAERIGDTALIEKEAAEFPVESAAVACLDRSGLVSSDQYAFSFFGGEPVPGLSLVRVTRQKADDEPARRATCPASTVSR